MFIGHVSGKIVFKLIFLKYQLLEIGYPASLLYFLPLKTPRKKVTTINEMKKMNACDAMLVLVPSIFMSFTRRRRLSCRRRWRSTSIATFTNWVLVSVWIFCYLVLGNNYLPFPFSRDSLRRVPCVSLALVFVETPWVKGFESHFQNGLVSFAHFLLYQLHYSQPLINEISMSTNMINIF